MPRIANPGSRRLDGILLIDDRFPSSPPSSEVWELLSEGRLRGQEAPSPVRRLMGRQGRNSAARWP